MVDPAIVTGSTNNIGKAIAEGLSEDGYHVIVTSRNEADTRRVADALPNEASGFEVDVSVPSEIDALFEFVEGEFGDLSVLVNNVAYTANESIFECDLETWERTIDTNLRSYFLCTQRAAELMKDTDGGNIVNVTISRTHGTTEKFSYSVSKGGVALLTGCAARDLAPYDIRVNAVGSGLVGTPVTYDDFQDRTLEQDWLPIGHIGEPADIAHAVRFLVSEKAKYIVGGMIPVDGGKEA